VRRVILAATLSFAVLGMQGCLSLPNKVDEKPAEKKNEYFSEIVKFKGLSQTQIYDASKNWRNNVVDYVSSRKIIQADEVNKVLTIKGHAGLKFDNCMDCLSRNMIKVADDSFNYILKIEVKDHQAKLTFSNIEPRDNRNNHFYKDKNASIKNQLKNIVEGYKFHILHPNAQPVGASPM